MGQLICTNTGLTRPECSCVTCIRMLMIEYAPESIRVTAIQSEVSVLTPSGQNGSAYSVGESEATVETPSVAERLARPAL